METIDKQELIETILKWEPTRHRGILAGLDSTTLKNILAEIVEAVVDERQERMDQAQAEIAVTRAAHQLRERLAREPQRQAEAAAASQVINDQLNSFMAEHPAMDCYANRQMLAEDMEWNSRTVEESASVLSGELAVGSQQETELSSRSKQQVLSQYASYLDGSPDAQKLRKWVYSTPLAEVRERLELAAQVVLTVGGSIGATQLTDIRGRQFRTLVLSPLHTTESLRQRVQGTQQRESFRKMTSEQLREYLQRNRGPQQQTTITLPPEITPDAIRKASTEQQKVWHRVYGTELLDKRLRGEA
jgi:hypothetical protein